FLFLLRLADDLLGLAPRFTNNAIVLFVTCLHVIVVQLLGQREHSGGGLGLTHLLLCRCRLSRGRLGRCFLHGLGGSVFRLGRGGIFFRLRCGSGRSVFQFSHSTFGGS